MPKGVFRQLYKVQCQDCGVAIESKRPLTKRCPDCGRTKTLADQRAAQQRTRKPCPDCGTSIYKTSGYCTPCSQKYLAPGRTGERNYNWKGGRFKDRRGYVIGRIGPGKRRAEHILVWEAANGPLPKGYIVHHVNHIKDDNRLENLVAMPRGKHNHQHGQVRILELEAQVRQLDAKVAAWEGRLDVQPSSTG